MSEFNPLKNLFEFDPDREHRIRMRRFFQSDIRIAPRKEEGIRVTFCDGEKHRTLSGGAYDRLEIIEPCNHECESWTPEKGEAIAQIIPNIEPEWVESKEDVDYSGDK